MPDRTVFSSGQPDAGKGPPRDSLAPAESGALFGVPGLPAHGGLEHITLTADGDWSARCPSCGTFHARSSWTKAAAWSWLVAHIGSRHGC